MKATPTTKVITMEITKDAPAQLIEQGSRPEAIEHYIQLRQEFAELVRSAERCRAAAAAAARESQEANESWKALLAGADGYQPNKQVNAEIDRSMRMRTLADQYQVTSEELERKIERDRVALVRARARAEAQQERLWLERTESELAAAGAELSGRPEFQRWMAALEGFLSAKKPSEAQRLAVLAQTGTPEYNEMMREARGRTVLHSLGSIHAGMAADETTPPADLHIPARLPGELAAARPLRLRALEMKFDAEGDWIGVGLDDDLAGADGDPLLSGPIGRPNLARIDQVKSWLAAGKEVRVHTRRDHQTVQVWLNKHGIGGAVISAITRNHLLEG